MLWVSGFNLRCAVCGMATQEREGNGLRKQLGPLTIRAWSLVGPTGAYDTKLYERLNNPLLPPRCASSVFLVSMYRCLDLEEIFRLIAHEPAAYGSEEPAIALTFAVKTQETRRCTSCGRHRIDRVRERLNPSRQCLGKENPNFVSAATVRSIRKYTRGIRTFPSDSTFCCLWVQRLSHGVNWL